MRIVVWNCRMALSRKWEHLYRLAPDVAVIPECSESCLKLCMRDGFDGRWFGDNPRKGLGILAAKPLHIRRAQKPLGKWVIPVTISSGPHNLRLIAVWTMPIPGSTTKSYIGQLYEAVVKHPQWFSGKDCIVCGDFNSNKFWDGSRKEGNHSALVQRLEMHGLVSSYHHFFSEFQRDESRPTYYFWHRKNRGYHIDYVFLPKEWAPAIKGVEVGSHADWAKLSDHVPVMVELTMPAI